MVDPIPTRVVIEYLNILPPVIVKLVSGSLESCVVSKFFETAVFKLLLKEPSLYPKLCEELQTNVQCAVHLQASLPCCNGATGTSLSENH